MKMRNKFLALLLAVSMSCSVSACGSADKQTDGKTATEDSAADKDNSENQTDYYAAATEKMKDISSMNSKMLMEIDMDLKAGDETQSMHTSTTVDMSCIYNPVRIKGTTKMDAGNDTTIEATVYAEKAEDGSYTMYMSNGSEWQSQTVDAESMKQYDAASNMNFYMQDKYNFQDAGSEQLDGKTAHKYTGVITGDDLRELIMSTGTLNSLNSLSLDESQFETILKDLGEQTITLWIDEAELYPLKYEMDMTSMMNSLMAGLIEAAGEEAEGFSIEFPKVNLVMTCSDFNAVSEFEIPEEAKAATPME